MSMSDDEQGSGHEDDALPERFTDTLPTAYFDRIYAESLDPWQFETSDYERDKYRATLAALPRRHYRHALEVGCSIGVLTHQLADRCDRILGVDLAQRALDRAAERCSGQSGVEFRLMRIPDQLPDGAFDLILISEVGYYWSAEDLDRMLDFAAACLPAGGTLELVHWVIAKGDYPLTGDEVHESAIAHPDFRVVHDERPVPYRLTVLERR